MSHQFQHLIDACGNDNEKLAELSMLFLEASLGVSLMEESGAPRFGVLEYVVAIRDAIDQIVRMRGAHG